MRRRFVRKGAGLLWRSCAVILLTLSASRISAATTPDDFAGVFPGGAVAYVSVSDLGQLIDRVERSDYLKAVLTSPQFEQARNTTPYRKAEAARALAERQLGVDPLVLVRQLLGQRISAAFYPNASHPQQPDSLAALKTDAVVLAKLRKQIDPLLVLADEVMQVSKGAHGEEIFSVGGKAFVAWSGDWLAASSRRELLDEYLVCMHETRPGSLAQDGPFAAMRVALAKSKPAASSSRRIIESYLNVAMLSQAAGGRAIPAKLDNPVASLLFGDSLEMAARSPYAALTVDTHDHGFVAAISVADSRGSLGESHRAFFPAADKPAVKPLPEVANLLGGFTIYRDFADWYVHREQLLQEQVLPGFDQFESGLANLLPGRDFGEDVLPTLGKRITFVAAPQTYEHLAAPPGVRLPGFALLIELGRPEEGADLMQLLFQSLTAIGNLGAGQQGRQPWVMTSETHGGVQISFAKYSKQPAGDSLGIVYNFLPAAARVGDHFVISSSLGLCRQLVDRLRQPEPPQTGEAVRTIDLQLRFDPLAAILADNREFLLGKLVQQGRTADQAGQEFD
jgi:hypothetical protein